MLACCGSSTGEFLGSLEQLHVHILQFTHGRQRTAHGTLFSLPTAWVLGIKLTSSELVINAFICLLSHSLDLQFVDVTPTSYSLCYAFYKFTNLDNQYVTCWSKMWTFSVKLQLPFWLQHYHCSTMFSVNSFTLYTHVSVDQRVSKLLLKKLYVHICMYVYIHNYICEGEMCVLQCACEGSLIFPLHDPS